VTPSASTANADKRYTGSKTTYYLFPFDGQKHLGVSFASLSGKNSVSARTRSALNFNPPFFLPSLFGSLLTVHYLKKYVRSSIAETLQNFPLGALTDKKGRK
jgi:hypothetical protein